MGKSKGKEDAALRPLFLSKSARDCVPLRRCPMGDFLIRPLPKCGPRANDNHSALQEWKSSTGSNQKKDYIPPEGPQSADALCRVHRGRRSGQTSCLQCYGVGQIVMPPRERSLEPVIDLSRRQD